MILALGLAFGIVLGFMFYWIARPEPPPSSLEEDIVRRAIAKINWRSRPTSKTQSRPYNPGVPSEGVLVVIPFDHSNSVSLRFSEGKVIIDGICVELAAPDSMDRLAGAIQRAWTAQYH
jgi:hypothetical protein